VVKVECRHKGETQSDTFDQSRSVFTLQEKIHNELVSFVIREV
jgi:hypothetical protein